MKPYWKIVWQNYWGNYFWGRKRYPSLDEASLAANKRGNWKRIERFPKKRVDKNATRK